MTEPRTITGNFEVAVSLTDRRSLKVSGYFFSDDVLEEMNKRVDMAQQVLDRQVVYCDVINKEAQIAGHEQNLENIKENFEGLKLIEKGGKKLTSQQKLTMDQFDPTIRSALKQIDSLRAAVKAGRAKLNGVAHD